MLQNIVDAEGILYPEILILNRETYMCSTQMNPKGIYINVNVLLTT